MEESTQPFPRRYWWVKRIALLMLLLVLALCGARAWYGGGIVARWDFQIPALRARNRPITFADLPPPPTVVRDENASIFLQRAAAIIGNSGSWHQTERINRLDDKHAGNAYSWDNPEKAIELLRQSRDRR